MSFKKIAAILLMSLLVLASANSPAVRIKDIATISGVRSNQLMGVGLVVGLSGTGDSSLRFTDRALTNLLKNLGAGQHSDVYRSKNVAAVLVTADLPPFIMPGQTIDVFVSSIGDAESLLDGTLLMTPLKGADDVIYAVAQGPVVQGTSVARQSSRRNATVAKVLDGAVVEKSVNIEFAGKNNISLLLNNPDFNTAERMAVSLSRGGYAGAKAINATTVEVPLVVEDKENIVSFVSRIGEFMVVPDSIARVVINQRTGTVVIGSSVRLAPVAVSHGDIEIQISGAEEAPTGDIEDILFGNAAAIPGEQVEGDTLVAENTPKRPNLVQLQAGVSLSSLVKALNSVGTSPEDIVAIVQALRAAGSLNAKVEVI